MLPSLRTIRDAQGISREKLAFAAGLSAQTIENLENGTDCRVATAQRIATALGVTVNDLMVKPKARRSA